MIKLKKLIKESLWGDRKFGEPLPTIKDYKEVYDKKIKEELLKEQRDNLIKKQTIKTPFGNLQFEVWEITTGPGESPMLSFSIDFNGTNIQDTTIEGKPGSMASVRHTPRAKKVRFK